MSTEYDPIKLTKLVIFGTNDLSSVDYNQLIRPMGTIPDDYHIFRPYSKLLRHSLIPTLP